MNAATTMLHPPSNVCIMHESSSVLLCRWASRVSAPGLATTSRLSSAARAGRQRCSYVTSEAAGRQARFITAVSIALGLSAVVRTYMTWLQQGLQAAGIEGCSVMAGSVILDSRGCRQQAWKGYFTLHCA